MEKNMQTVMKTILAIHSSASGEHSASRQLAQHWMQNQQARIEEVDLSAANIPHLNGETVGAFFTPPAQRTAEQQQAVVLSDFYIKQLQDADALVISVPMYNFGVPSTLKAWFDHVARAGVTFQYTETGPKGLLQNKKAIIVTSRGGLYKESGFDHQMPFIKQFLGFIGITDVQVVYAEGLSMGEDAKQAAMSQAKAHLESIA